MKIVTNQQFDKHMKEIQATLAFEGQELTSEELEKLRSVCTGAISELEYDAWLQEKVGMNRHE